MVHGNDPAFHHWKCSQRGTSAVKTQVELRLEVKRLMADGWRAAVLGPVRKLRHETTASLGDTFDATVLDLRRRAIDAGRCDVCEQDVHPIDAKPITREFVKD